MPQPKSPIAPQRGHGAADALLAAREELRGRVPPTHRLAPWLYANRVIEGDDEYGTRAGLVVQGDAVPWSSLDGLLDLATYGALAHARIAHYPRRVAAGCALCDSATKLWHTALTDPLVRQRCEGTVTERHDAMRAVVVAELAALSIPQSA